MNGNYSINGIDIFPVIFCNIFDDVCFSIIITKKTIFILIPLITISIGIFSFITAFIFIWYDYFYKPHIYKIKKFPKNPNPNYNSKF